MEGIQEDSRFEFYYNKEKQYPHSRSRLGDETDRNRNHRGGDLIIISPRDREEFIRVIWEINPQVKTPGTNRTRISSLLGLPQRLIYLVKIKATYPIISLKDSSLAWITCSIWSAFKAVERKRLSNCDGAR